MVGKSRAVFGLAAVAVVLGTLGASSLPAAADESGATAGSGQQVWNERHGDDGRSGFSGLVEQEWHCSQHQYTPGYFRSLNGAEVADAQRSQLYPCADFTGSHVRENVVTGQQSVTPYQGATFLNNRYPGEVYVVGGDQPPTTGPVPLGPFVAKTDPYTGKEIWRTTLDDANKTGDWIAATNLNILQDGNIVFAWSHYIVLLDPNTGRVIKRVELPTGPAEPEDANYKHVTIAPDGTLIVKEQNKPKGCTVQGSAALIVCPGVSDPSLTANSEMLALDPKTLDILDAVTVPEMTATPHTITWFHGKIAIYTCGTKNLYRYFWNPRTQKLTQDKSFVVSFLGPGQTSGDAPGILGDWVVIQTNGLPANVPSSVVAVNQDDPTRITRISPYGALPPGTTSWAPPKAAVDDENSMVYSDDYGAGQIAGIKFDRATGEMTAAFVTDDRTTCLQALYGPKDHRVLGVSQINPNATSEQLSNGTYTEQATFRDAATGRILATSDFYQPMTSNTLITPTYGGGFYFPTDSGYIHLEVKPAPLSKPPSAPHQQAPTDLN
jgi:outer membrane protein assembly factor BamB